LLGAANLVKRSPAARFGKIRDGYGTGPSCLIPAHLVASGTGRLENTVLNGFSRRKSKRKKKLSVEISRTVLKCHWNRRWGFPARKGGELPGGTRPSPRHGEEEKVAIELPAVRILIVDDDRAICDYMQTLLERDGYEVKTLGDPLAVEEEVRTGGYHLIILDLMMPKLDGIEVLKRIRKVDNDIAVVIFTGYPNLESAVASMKLDAVDYIKKPFNVDEFREVLARVMRKKGLARTPEEQLHRVIGDTIRNLRKDKDLTLKQMARRTGLSVSLLSQIERAESSASISSLYKIAVALESRIQDLFGQY
jgi:DNA-binding response OmpR family regulator